MRDAAEKIQLAGLGAIAHGVGNVPGNAEFIIMATLAQITRRLSQGVNALAKTRFPREEDAPFLRFRLDLEKHRVGGVGHEQCLLARHAEIFDQIVLNEGGRAQEDIRHRKRFCAGTKGRNILCQRFTPEIAVRLPARMSPPFLAHDPLGRQGDDHIRNGGETGLLGGGQHPLCFHEDHQEVRGVAKTFAHHFRADIFMRIDIGACALG